MTETPRRRMQLDPLPQEPLPVPEITEGELTFSFPNGCEASKYDIWTFYRKQFQSVAGGSKAVDILCMAGGIVWLIEVKDYRQYPRTKPSDLGDEVAVKVRDTLSGLSAACANADSISEKDFARWAVETGAWRVVLHLEQSSDPEQSTRLRPTAINPADVKLKLSQKLKAVDPKPVVMNTGLLVDVPWSVQEAEAV